MNQVKLLSLSFGELRAENSLVVVDTSLVLHLVPDSLDCRRSFVTKRAVVAGPQRVFHLRQRARSEHDPIPVLLAENAVVDNPAVRQLGPRNLFLPRNLALLFKGAQVTVLDVELVVNSVHLIGAEPGTAGLDLLPRLGGESSGNWRVCNKGDA